VIGMPQGWEVILIIFVILLLFGAAKLPDLARGTGRAMRIFKAETKGLRDDNSGESADDETEPRGLTSGKQISPAQPAAGDDAAKRAGDN
jgi:sec-independent protein translocase protein TatA